MKEIIIKFLTTKGVDSYNKMKDVKLNFTERNIEKIAFKQRIINEKPLTLHIKIKIEWLAIKIELDKKIKETLKNYGCEENKDFEMSVY